MRYTESITNPLLVFWKEAHVAMLNKIRQTKTLCMNWKMVIFLFEKFEMLNRSRFHGRMCTQLGLHFMFSTTHTRAHAQAADTRRALLCWDEPFIKASFNVTLIVPKDFVALSNMVSIIIHLTHVVRYTCV